jgi:hypothetical protein
VLDGLGLDARYQHLGRVLGGTQTHFIERVPIRLAARTLSEGPESAPGPKRMDRRTTPASPERRAEIR